MNLVLCRWWKMNMLQQCVYLGGMKRRTIWGFDSCSLTVQSAVAPTFKMSTKFDNFNPTKCEANQMFLISGSFGGIETQVEVAGWGATTRRGGRSFSSLLSSFYLSSFSFSFSSSSMHSSLWLSSLCILLLFIVIVCVIVSLHVFLLVCVLVLIHTPTLVKMSTMQAGQHPPVVESPPSGRW